MKLDALEAPLLAQGFDGDDLADESIFSAAQLDIIIPQLAGEEKEATNVQKRRFLRKIVKLRVSGVPAQLCAPPPLAPLPGEIDTTRLAIDRADLIGSGGFGTVYGAVLDGAPVAVKLVKPEQSPYGPLAMRKMLVEEVEIMKKACDSTSSGVCELFGTVALRTGELGLVMKRYTRSLQDEIDRCASTGGMRMKRVLYIATHVARAAAELHAVNPPILLRDLKPDNILIDHHAHPVIADFGCAGQAGMSSMVEQTRGGTGFSFTGRVVGTTRYMAPEQIGWKYPKEWKYSGFARVSSHADVWAFACTVGAMLIRGPLWGEADERMIGGSLKTWKVDFDAEEFKAAIDLPLTCPLPLKGIVEQCLVVPPYDRPSFTELATQLGRIVLPVERG